MRALVLLHRNTRSIYARPVVRSFWASSSSTSSSASAPSDSTSAASSAPKNDSEQQSQQANAAADAPTAQPSELESKYKELESQHKDLKNTYLRALADAENLRERTRREKELAQQLAIKSFAVDLLSVADILDIALSSVPEDARNDDKNPHLKNLFTGLQMTRDEMQNTFRRHKLVVFEPKVGDQFDPNRHMAMFQAPAEEGKQPGTVMNVMKKGYTLHEIVVRAAQVGVFAEKQ